MLRDGFAAGAAAWAAAGAGVMGSAISANRTRHPGLMRPPIIDEVPSASRPEADVEDESCFWFPTRPEFRRDVDVPADRDPRAEASGQRAFTPRARHELS